MSLLGGGIYLARAAAGGPTRAALSFAGTLRVGSGVPGETTLTFDFKKNGSRLCSPAISVTPDSSGAFQAEIPITSCPSNLFDGSDVVVDVVAGETVIVANQPINPVPYAKYADQAAQMGDPDCPLGWTKDSRPPNPMNPLSVLCRRGPEEIVKVGTGPSAFWIDRYEATFNTQLDNGGGKSIPTSLPANGQWAPNAQGTLPGYALSVVGETPLFNVTWFQASALCAFSGKRLPMGDEWLRAAVGTPDPQQANAGAGPCFTSGTGARLTGMGVICSSNWGAQDMIGNVWEWTNEWFFDIGGSNTLWPDGYNMDFSYASGLTVATLRGGSFLNNTGAGIFSSFTGGIPPAAYYNTGFRCVIPR